PCQGEARLNQNVNLSTCSNTGTKIAENANKIILHKTGAMRSEDGSLHTDQSAANNKKIPRRRYYIASAQTLPFRECVTFTCKGYLHSA
ncbi:MAG: hypothetical protein FWE95_03235, partial [Planctomycetaceae bacterium]|nr:hypothetical protein [Planctomycetaceae bacterium]